MPSSLLESTTANTATSRTPHRRRRKIPASTAKPISTATDKENGSDNTRTLAVNDEDDWGIIDKKTWLAKEVQQPPRRILWHDGLEDADDDEEEEDASNNDEALAEFHSSILQKACLEMKEAMLMVGPSPTLFEESNEELLSSVLQLSLFSNRRAVSSTSRQGRSFRHAQGRCDALLKEAKRLLQQETDGREQHGRTFARLYVAIHCVRAVVAMMGMLLLQDQAEDASIVTRQETCLKVLHHWISAAVEDATTTTTVNSSEREPRSSWMVLAGVEALQWLLVQYISCYNSGVVHFIPGSQGLAVPSKHQGAANTLTNKNRMTLRQVITIGFKAYLAAATAIDNLRQSSSLSSLTSQEEAATHGTWAQQWTLNGTAHEFLSLAYRAWLAFVLTSGDPECLKDVIGHAKLGHRFLWDLAANVKEPETALKIRQAAIVTLLPSSPSESYHPITRSLVRDLFQAACGYAWKAASVFAQPHHLLLPITSRNSPMWAFHIEIGTLLDNTAMQWNLDAEIAYEEYCVYRAWHCGILTDRWHTHREDCTNPPLSMPPLNDLTAGSAILSAILVAIQAHQRLYDMDNIMGNIITPGSPCSASDHTMKVRVYCDKLAERISSIVESSHDSMTLQIQNRYFKLISSLSIHRTIFQAVSKHDKQPIHYEALEILSLVVSQCIGPLMHLFATTNGNQDLSKREPMLAAAVECYVRPLSAFEILQESCTKEAERVRYEGLANDTISAMYRLFFEQQQNLPLSSSLLEKCAKSVAMVGRHRSENNITAISSILPSLYALSIYRYLADHNVGDSSGGSTYQLAARLAHLACTLQASGLYYHAMVVHSCVLTQELPHCYPAARESRKEVDFLEFLASRSKHALSPVTSDLQPTTLAKASIRRMVAVADALYTSRESHIKLNCTQELAWRAFLSCLGCGELLDEEEHEPHNLLPQLLSTIVLPAAKKSEIPLDDTRHDTKVFFLLIDVMVDVGTSMDRSASSSCWQVEACRVIASILPVTQIGRSLGSSPNVVAALIQVLLSTCLMPSKIVDFSRKYREDDVAESGPFIHHLREAIRLLESQTKEHRNELLTVTILHLLWHVEKDRTESSNHAHFDRFQRAIKLFHEGSSRLLLAGDHVGQFYRRSFLWALSHFQCYLESGGDPIRSIISMHWIMEVCRGGGDGMEAIWCQSTAADTMLSSPLSTLYCSTFDRTLLLSISEESVVGSPQRFAQLELHLALFRARLSFGSHQQPDASSLMNSVQSLLPEQAGTCDALELGARDAKSKWIMSSLHLTLTEYFAASGNFTMALKHLQEACRYCMKVVSLAQFINLSACGDIGPHWAYVSLSTLLQRATQRYAQLLSLRSRIYSRIGDHRKAVAYLGTLSEFLGIESEKVDPEAGLNIQVLLNDTSRLQEKNFRRLNAEIRCSVMSQDDVAKGLEDSGPTWLHEALSESHDASRQVQVILDALSAGDLIYCDSIQRPIQASFRPFYESALACFSTFVASHNLLGSLEQVGGSSKTRLSAKVTVREIRCLLSVTKKLDESVHERVQDLCTKVIENCVADKTDRAWALYYLAEQTIAFLRRSGSLRRLWDGEEDVVPKEDRRRLEQARTFLNTAATLHAIGSDILSRTLLRTLALVAGPENRPLTNKSAGALVLMSIGQSYRQQMIRSLSDSESEPSDRVQLLLEIFDMLDGDGIDGDGITQLLNQVASVSPDDWKFVAVTFSPSGDILMTSIAKDSNSGAISMKTARVEPRDSQSAYDDIMVPLDDIVQESQKQLQGMDVSAVSEYFSQEEAKRKWWGNRHKLDVDMQDLLERVESTYFPSLHMCMFSGESIFQSAEDSENLPVGNLASKFEAMVETEPAEEEATDESLRKLTVPKLKDLLRDDYGFTESKFRKMKKQDLIDLYLEHNKPKVRSRTATGARTGACLFLLLDENLHRFPFEGMPSLFGNTVCRVPSLTFVLASLLDRSDTIPNQVSAVDPASASFVLDPECNLIATRNRIRPVLEEIAMKHNWEWNAAVGEMPSESFFADGLCREDGLFLYFGHGGAQTCFSRKQVEKLIVKRDGHDVRACRSTVILMGCSSGRLVSVNRKHSHSIDHQIPLHYEPEGIALSYLCAGAPCVVGNLWDVTDRDIDRYSITLLESFLKQQQQQTKDGGASLANCVAVSRNICKLRYIVGCAPVCYGVPVHLRKDSSR